jgi:hypothetical protein
VSCYKYIIEQIMGSLPHPRYCVYLYVVSNCCRVLAVRPVS